MLSDKLGLQANTEALWHKTARQGYQSKRRHLNHRLTASSPPQPFVPSATTPSQAALQPGRRCLGDPCLLPPPCLSHPCTTPLRLLLDPPTAYRGPSQCQQPAGQHLRPYVTLTLRLSSCPEHLIPALGSQRQPTQPEVRLWCLLSANPNLPPLHLCQLSPPPPSKSILTPFFFMLCPQRSSYTASHLRSIAAKASPQHITCNPPPPPPLLAPAPFPYECHERLPGKNREAPLPFAFSFCVPGHLPPLPLTHCLLPPPRAADRALRSLSRLPGESLQSNLPS